MTEELYDRAVAIVKQDGRASTSYVQRRLEIGYTRAAEINFRMEKEGVVSEPDATGRRSVLVEAQKSPPAG